MRFSRPIKSPVPVDYGRRDRDKMLRARPAEIAVVGRACRFPGANSTADLWTLLRDGRCSVSKIPSDRWCLERFGHPRQGERGRSYSWAAGVLEDIWGFDPTAFGLSPREAAQMDPQQRLLLELTWEALEDAGIRPSSLIGSETGVFVGASTVDYGNSKLFDVAATDGYFATGNAASILANRISYVFDLNGPSLTVDTACSSSLVALDAAVQALQSGRIDFAIVGGVSILATPFQFIHFSQASMLSRTGLCQPFSSGADGYVRAEGGAVLVLRAVAGATGDGRREHARIVATRVNSDGRTNGIALPSAKRQAQLLQQIYDANDLDPDDLAFVEAHGTGTAVGDPIEAVALGKVLGMRRTRALPIGSIKSNIGHTEAVAGLAGLYKAILALEHDLLPASLHCESLNPAIDFDELGLDVARGALPLQRSEARRIAGVSSYGFGGTNAHVVLTDPRRRPDHVDVRSPAVLMLSAHSQSALSTLARQYAAKLPVANDPLTRFVAAANLGREMLAERLVVPLDDQAAMSKTLNDFAEGSVKKSDVVVGTAVSRQASVAFVYAGNGSQWVGMGRAAYRDSAAFRAGFDAVDALFETRSGWSLVAMMHSQGLAHDLARTSVAQPMIFAIQVATTCALKEAGLEPAFVLGHSVGEVAAAAAAGVVDLATAVKIIFYRSQHQESVFGIGGMAVLVGPRDLAQSLAADVPGLTVAAYNSPKATTFSGSTESLERLALATKGVRARVSKLDLFYPFHSSLVDAIEQPLLADLDGLRTQPGMAAVVSTVTGSVLAGTAFDASYWWRNVREPVLFSQAVEEAFRLGARVFVEIGPSPILLSHISDTLASRDTPCAVLSVLEQKQPPGDPFTRAVAAALARGARVDANVLFGSIDGAWPDLPLYPWQKDVYRLGETTEHVGLLSPRSWHPLIGARIRADELDWHCVIDTAILPELADHVVDQRVLLPGTGFAEMAVAVARAWLETDSAAIADLQILQPLMLDAGISREIRCRVQPLTGLVEMMSRPRLGQVGWQSHATAKILKNSGEARDRRLKPLPEGVPTMSGNALYKAAARSGLHYGPAFRLLVAAHRLAPDLLAIELTEAESDERFALDPARVDACFHGLALLYAELSVASRLKPYVPVSIAELQLYRPKVPIRRASIQIVRSDHRAIVAHLSLFDAAGVLIAELHGVRFQAMTAFRQSDRAIELVIQTSCLATEPLAVREDPGLSVAQILAAVCSTDGDEVTNGPPPLDFVLLEGWATALAFDFIRSLAGRPVFALDDALEHGSVPKILWPWCGRLLAALEQSELVSKDASGCFLLSQIRELPDPRDIVRTLASEHPERSAELMLASRATVMVESIMKGEFEAFAPFTSAALEAFELGGQVAKRSADLIGKALSELGHHWPQERAIRILQVGDSPLSGIAAEIIKKSPAELTILETDRRRSERVRLALEGQDHVSFLAAYEELRPESFDLVIACQTLHLAAADAVNWTRLAESLAPGAALLAVEPAISVFRDLVFGLPGHPSQTGARPFAPALTESSWRRALADLQLGDVSVTRTQDTDLSLLCIGQKSEYRLPETVKGSALVLGSFDDPSAVDAALATMLRFAGLKVTTAFEKDLCEPIGMDAAEHIVFLAQDLAIATSAERIADRCLKLRDLVAKIAGTETTLWLVCPGATREGYDANAVEAAVWAFARTLSNEVPTLDVRILDLAPGLPVDVAARRLKDAVLARTNETEIVLDHSATRVVRFERVETNTRGGHSAESLALRLTKGEGSGLDRMSWSMVERRAPKHDEIEIEIDAAGLNFRDVMWGLSILPEEILENGYAGATLGLECAGRIVKIGSGVDTFEVGDRVMAFAKSALATHVTVEAHLAAPMPEGLSPEAASAIPVAFLTAYYALIHCARLEPDEWVLIHGAAGGVGLAALQIARWRGARVVATAGSDERRDLLLTLGAEHVFDSRSTAFVDGIRRVMDAGVDVVLNSLSGEAMERSIAVLKPFGRFVELGKRDYVANTHVGLKPFRRNLAYFGVDLDQLMLKSASGVKALFNEVMVLFAEGALSPLPYRVFPARDVVEGFRLMQRSGHIGKIVISPPALPILLEQVAQPLVVAPDRTHLVTGGLNGFGLETARWLVDRGARHLLLVGRSGASHPDAQAAVDTFRAAGVQVEIAGVDIADEPAVSSLFLKLPLTMPPLAGVVHAAAAYADSVVSNLNRETLETVLRAKVTGAEILDRLTTAMPLDYFILYSSATTLIGNPGQGAYVAANAFLEGLARRRRHAGLPALAVAWGAIEDAGVLTRSGPGATNLLARSGVLGIKAATALDKLAEAIPDVLSLPNGSSLAIAAVNWSAARDHLRVMHSPTFSHLTRGLKTKESGAGEKLVLRDLLAQYGVEDAKRRIADTVQDEIARILRLPREDVIGNKPLMEIGLDSLMAVELAMGLEERFALDAPLTASAGAMTVRELAAHLVDASTGSREGGDAASERLATRHLDADLRKEAIEAFPKIGEVRGSTRKEVARLT